MELFALLLLLIGVLGFFSEGFTLLTFWQFFRGKSFGWSDGMIGKLRKNLAKNNIWIAEV